MRISSGRPEAVQLQPERVNLPLFTTRPGARKKRVKSSEIKNLITLPSHFLLSRLWRLCNCINVIQLHESTRLEKRSNGRLIWMPKRHFSRCFACLTRLHRWREILWARKCDENLVLWRDAHTKGPRWWEHQPTLLMINKEAVEGNLISRPS